MPVFSAAPSIASHTTSASIFPVRSAAKDAGPAPVEIPVYWSGPMPISARLCLRLKPPAEANDGAPIVLPFMSSSLVIGESCITITMFPGLRLSP